MSSQWSGEVEAPPYLCPYVGGVPLARLIHSVHRPSARAASESAGQERTVGPEPHLSISLDSLLNSGPGNQPFIYPCSAPSANSCSAEGGSHKGTL